MSLLKKINTKLEAYKLIHDPIKLLCLLYSKYGDIEEDLEYYYINQIWYNKSSHYNLLFKEIQYLNFVEDFCKRFYSIKESLKKIPKLNDYYKNYHNFFCRPIFRNFKIYEIMNNYGDNKAEIFYKNNYEIEEKKNESLNINSFSSFDNITNNKTIFDQKIRNFINNNNSYNKCTLTLDTSRTLKSNVNLLSKRSKDSSFIKFISPFINYKQIDLNKKEEKTINEKNLSNNKSLNKKKLKLKNRLEKNSNIKSSLYNLVKNNLNCEIIKHNKKKTFKSPKLNPYLSNYKSSLEEFNKNKIKYIEKLNYGNEIKNKTYNSNSNIKIFSKSSTLNNNISIGKNNSMLNNMNNQNKSNSKKKSNKILNGNINDIIIKKKKNINSNSIIKYHSNSNFSTIKVNRKSNYNSDFNLIKSPINSINRFSNLSIIKFSKNNSFNSKNNKNNIMRNNSSSNSKNKKKITMNHRKNSTIDYNNILFSIQKSVNLNNISSPKNTILSNRIHLNNNISRNKKNMINNTQTNIKTYRKDNISHKAKSIDIEKLKLKNIFFGSKNNYQMSQRLFNQIEELIKKSNAPFLKYNYLNKLNIHKKTINNNHSNSSLHNNHSGCNISIKFNSSKTINVNSMKINNKDKKEKRIRIISPKK